MAAQEVITTSVGHSILEASRKMREHSVGCLIVTDDMGKVAGIITERDIVNCLATDSLDPDAKRVQQAMTSTLAVCPPGTSLQQAGEIMASQGVRHLPIVEDGAARGIISIRDILAEQLSRHRAMQAAAERVAMLATSLKALDFTELINMVTSEVPGIFQASKCVLCLPSSVGPRTSDAKQTFTLCLRSQGANILYFSCSALMPACFAFGTFGLLKSSGDIPHICGETKIPFSAQSLITSSLMKNACSMLFPPALMNRLTARSVKMCAVTYVPQSSAASTAARISSNVY